MAAIFGPGGPIILPLTVRGDRFSGGTVHGVTELPRRSIWALRLHYAARALHVRVIQQRVEVHD